MAIPDWPAELPQCLRPNYETSYPDARLRSKTELGPGKTRRRGSAAAQPLSADIWLTAAQKARLDRFFYEETGWGVRPFRMHDPERHMMPLLDSAGALLLDSSGEPLRMVAYRLIQFDNLPQVRSLGATYRVTLSLFAMP